jgi:hypothetical protein
VDVEEHTLNTTQQQGTPNMEVLAQCRLLLLLALLLLYCLMLLLLYCLV